MICHDRDHLLFIEPVADATEEPVLDELTGKMAGAWQHRRVSGSWRGFHICSCGAHSDHQDYSLKTTDGQELKTNSLALHYLAYHRSEVPRRERAKVMRLIGEPVTPSRTTLRGETHGGFGMGAHKYPRSRQVDLSLGARARAAWIKLGAWVTSRRR